MPRLSFLVNYVIIITTCCRKICVRVLCTFWYTMVKPLQASSFMGGPMHSCSLNDCIWKIGNESRKLLCSHQPVKCRLSDDVDPTTVIFRRINDSAIVGGMMWCDIREKNKNGYILDDDTLCDVLEFTGVWHQVRLSQFCDLK